MDLKEEKYIIDKHKFNCPICQAKSANFEVFNFEMIYETLDKKLCMLFLQCKCCNGISAYLFKDFNLENSPALDQLFSSYLIHNKNNHFLNCNNKYTSILRYDADTKIYNSINDNIIMTIPHSNITIHPKIPNILKDLLVEAETCLINNAIIGASACVRKAIYEFLKREKAQGTHYQEQISYVKTQHKNKNLDIYFDIIIQIQGMTSYVLHENDCLFEKLNSNEIRIYIQILNNLFVKIYVEPELLKEQQKYIQEQYNKIKKS